MDEAREAILNRIRSSLGRGHLSGTAERDLDKRMAAPLTRLTPGRVRIEGDELVQEFVRMTTGEATTVSFSDSTGEVPDAVAAFLKSHGLPESAVLAPDRIMEQMPWHEAEIQVRFGRAEADDLTSVTPAFAGIAETGCIMLLSGANHPYTLNFLPENHIAVLKSSRVVPTPEDAFDLLRKEFGPEHMPRTVLMAAGPSRSADIGYSLQFGAHGPRRLHCILVN